MGSAIKVSHLSFRYAEDAKEALEDLSFEVEEGQYAAIIGHNGSGKSTLAKILAGLKNDFEGQAYIFDTELKKENLTEIRSKLGLVFQNPDNQFVGSSVQDDIAFGLENRKVDPDKMDDIILEYTKKVGMEKELESPPENLSGGQKQRVAIAGILSLKPDILILDEATSMLDPLGKREMLALLKEIKKENPRLTILSITHDVEEAYAADEVLVLNEGKLVLQGSPKEVFSHERELREIRLEAPFFVRFKEELVKQGIKIADSVSTLEELEDYLCR